MAFIKEPNAYHNTALSDLQGTWSVLRTAVTHDFDFPNSDDEAMSWGCVRNLKLMKETLLIVQNIAAQSASEEINALVEMVRGDLEEVFSAIKEGEKL